MTTGEEGVVDNSTEDQAATTPDPVRQELAELKETMKAQQALLMKLSEAATPKEKKEALEALPPETAKSLKDNPDLLMKFIQQQVDGAKREFEGTVQRTDWDRRAESEFPALKTDKGFQDTVKKHVNDLLAGGEFTKNSPRLIYMASKLAAAEYKPQKTSKEDGEPSGMAPTGHTVSAAKGKIADTDPRVKVAIANGFSGERLEKFKARLVQNAEAARGRGR